ncbi:hypothetical protein BATDEDRAFT_88543 [Batrachochytrium dendrobatidis JAM81]|uniref:Uncharacterized protein n=1 Tax=Batrachochytrium dendrobatidis (strain JAM81 / FGSC 10211) TaxID=684364 RepID=F4P3R1_BATDJ|nr:uncharacterized protein BATDEDRAFT_88543 [Batrachochytrium dendrobatidis JAM81]EGF80381.1 hypothetical protein BATDEDRAFT_88543 [Batrachochytrium dendrobatidis JAM81]|eukprot:XP_006679267.1 hypothetical protein BATDEDRAFT_88543 [Batrachochytrium dendrobatidis JAM81]
MTAAVTIECIASPIPNTLRNRTSHSLPNQSTRSATGSFTETTTRISDRLARAQQLAAQEVAVLKASTQSVLLRAIISDKIQKASSKSASSPFVQSHQLSTFACSPSLSKSTESVRVSDKEDVVATDSKNPVSYGISKQFQPVTSLGRPIHTIKTPKSAWAISTPTARSATPVRVSSPRKSPAHQSTPHSPKIKLQNTSISPSNAPLFTKKKAVYLKNASQPNESSVRFTQSLSNPLLTKKQPAHTKPTKKEFRLPVSQSAPMVTRSGLRIKTGKASIDEMSHMRRDMDIRLINTYNKYIKALDTQTVAASARSHHSKSNRNLKLASTVSQTTNSQSLINNKHAHTTASSQKSKVIPTTNVSKLPRKVSSNSSENRMGSAKSKSDHMSPKHKLSAHPIAHSPDVNTTSTLLHSLEPLAKKNIPFDMDRLLELIPEALMVRMTALVASKIDPLLESAQQKLNSSADKLEMQVQDAMKTTRAQSPKPIVSNSASSPQPPVLQNQTDVIGSTKEFSSVDAQLDHSSKSDALFSQTRYTEGDVIHVASTPPFLPEPALQPPPIQTSLHSTSNHTLETTVSNTKSPQSAFPVPFSNQNIAPNDLENLVETCQIYTSESKTKISTDFEAIVIEKPSAYEMAKRHILKDMALASKNKEQDDTIDQSLQTLVLPQSVVTRIELGRARRMRHLAAHMECAVISLVETGRSVKGPWDSIERITTECVDEVFESVCNDIQEFVNLYIDMIAADEFDNPPLDSPGIQVI